MATKVNHSRYVSTCAAAFAAAILMLSYGTSAQGQARIFEEVSLNGGAPWSPAVMGDPAEVAPSATVSVTLEIRTPASSPWGSTRWATCDGGCASEANWIDSACVDHENHREIGNNVWTETIIVQAPDAEGTYDLRLDVYSTFGGDGCQAPLDDTDTFVLIDALHVCPGGVCDDTENEGCGPGYWKNVNTAHGNHLCHWADRYDPDDLFSETCADCDGGEVCFADAFPGKTLIEVLGPLKKGDGVDSPQLASLGYHAVAALLNAASPDVAYGIATPCEVIEKFNTAWDQDQESINEQKEEFADFNEADQNCPLGNCRENEPQALAPAGVADDRRAVAGTGGASLMLIIAGLSLLKLGRTLLLPERRGRRN